MSISRARGVILNNLLMSTVLAKYRYNTNEGRIRCPLHDDSTPSFFWEDSKNVFNCFGCGAGGSPIEFIQQYEQQHGNQMGQRELLKFIAEQYSINIPDVDGKIISKTKTKEVTDLKISKDIVIQKKVNRQEQRLKQLPVRERIAGYYFIDRYLIGLEEGGTVLEQLEQLFEQSREEGNE